MKMKYLKMLPLMVILSPVVIVNAGCEASSVNGWNKTHSQTSTSWTCGDIRYTDWDGDGKIDSKKIGLMIDGGTEWADTNKDGFFDTVYEHNIAGPRKTGTIHVAVPRTD